MGLRIERLEAQISNPFFVNCLMNETKKNSPNAVILSARQSEHFIGRTSELKRLVHHATKEKSRNKLLLLSAPALGASELLRQTYDRLFQSQNEIIPFYFALKNSDKTAKKAALRFLREFLLQTVAFRRRDTKILNASPDVCELAQLAIPKDGYWIDRLIENCQSESSLNNEQSFVKNCLSAPLRAVANSAECYVMIDDLHKSVNFAGDFDFIEELKDVFNRTTVPLVFSGHRRFIFDRMQCFGDDNLELQPLSFADAGLLVERLSASKSVKINDQTRDLISVQFDGNPTFINFMIESAAEKKVELDSFQSVQKIYTDELFGGRFGKFYDDALDEISTNIATQKNIVGLLYDSLNLDLDNTPIESWHKRLTLSEADFSRAVTALNAFEFVRKSSNYLEIMREHQVLTDYVTARFRLETVGEARALVFGETLSGFLKRAPKSMARFYRRSFALGLREILLAFNSQSVPESLLDYSLFKNEFKGAPVDEILNNLDEAERKIQLPQFVYATPTAAFYLPISQVVEKERSVVALGFHNCRYTDEDEIIWITAEIDSKLEASKDLAEFWCDRLEMVALMCNFANYKLWLIAPEGFSPAALEILKYRNAYGSSRRQIETLIKYLKAENVIREKLNVNEYEMVVPMGDDTELIAAHAVEEIARRHHFESKAINQIKTALVEACINAAEHSHSPDQKIYQKFSIEKDKITITISNRGLRLTDKNAQEIKPDEGRRGWGLKLMKTLMDDVRFEQVDDGTRISMTKYLKK